MYTPYADKEYYTNEYEGTLIDESVLNKALKNASRHVDELTFNRIVANGFENLTSYQQDIVKECVCELADFEYDNADMIANVLQSYSINGVSMAFGETWNIFVMNGVAIRRDTMKKLESTGLCYRGLGR